MDQTVSTRLEVFLGEAERSPMIWGESDCSAWVAKWLEDVTGRAVDLPKWASREEADALVAHAGSLVALWSEALTCHGLVETFAPVAGDVGIIDSHLFGQVGVIFLGAGYVAWRGEPIGYRILRPRENTIRKAWSLT